MLLITHKDIGMKRQESWPNKEKSHRSCQARSKHLKRSTSLFIPPGDVLQSSFGLNLLARAAANPHPLPPVGAAVEPTNPYVNQNCCLYPNCCVTLVPSICCSMSCTGKVHQYCSYTHQSLDSSVIPSLIKLPMMESEEIDSCC